MGRFVGQATLKVIRRNPGRRKRGWIFVLVLPTNRDMVDSYIHVLAAAFMMGLAAAAPIGPVNMMAIRRGVAGGWRHTLACAIGSIAGDLVLFSLALIGGSYLLPRLSSPRLRTVLETVGAVVLIPVGIYFLALVFKHPHQALRSARRNWAKGPIPVRLIGEAAKAAALTLFNPLTMVFWIAVTTSWLPLASSVFGNSAPAWGIVMVGLGLMTWFSALIALVGFAPHRTGATLFRLANAFLGLVLIGFGTYCATNLIRPMLR